MSKTTLIRLTLTLLMVGIPLAEAGGPIDLLEYICVFQQSCGAVSSVCWTPYHPFGGSNCTYCTGNTKQDMCEKAFEATCKYINQNQACGYKMVGSCLFTGQEELGACVSGVPLDDQSCSVPRC